MPAQKGKFLFRVSAENSPADHTYAIFAAALAMIVTIQAFSGDWSNWGWVVFFGSDAIRSFLPRRVAICANGIRFPPEPLVSRKCRFVQWSQIERFHWEGDILTIVPATSFLGGASPVSPLAGGSLQVPPAERLRVDLLLMNARRVPLA